MTKWLPFSGQHVVDRLLWEWLLTLSGGCYRPVSPRWSQPWPPSGAAGPAPSVRRPGPGPGSSDDARIRHLTLALAPQHAARLFDAQDAGASEQQLRDIAAEGLGDMYFRDGGRRAHGLEVEFTDVEHLENSTCGDALRCGGRSPVLDIRDLLCSN
ncbi:telomere-protecting terminal protein Tpg [Streptomyces sp. NPDC014991]|uniref:telomere-protecting terminal protein Tpg n=1 Tax=Streptomyces sp. NPDC014991 TaxID=3364935 RepID=UPI0036F4EDFD